MRVDEDGLPVLHVCGGDAQDDVGQVVVGICDGCVNEVQVEGATGLLPVDLVHIPEFSITFAFDRACQLCGPLIAETCRMESMAPSTACVVQKALHAMTLSCTGATAEAAGKGADRCALLQAPQVQPELCLSHACFNTDHHCLGSACLVLRHHRGQGCVTIH